MTVSRGDAQALGRAGWYKEKQVLSVRRFTEQWVVIGDRGADPSVCLIFLRKFCVEYVGGRLT